MGRVMQINYGSAIAGSKAKDVANAFSRDGTLCKKVPPHLEQAARLISSISQINSAKSCVESASETVRACESTMNHFAMSYSLFMRNALSKELIVSASFNDISTLITTREERKSFSSIFAAAFKEYPIEKERLSVGLSIEDLEKMLKSGEKIDATKWKDTVYYPIKGVTWPGEYKNTNGCTWYAMTRYNQVNGTDNGLQFKIGGGNAGEWSDKIDDEKHTVTREIGKNLAGIKANSIAVETTTPQRVGHVAYIEAVTDDYVYYTEGSAGYDKETFGYIVKVTKEEFAKRFDDVIIAK